MKKQRNALGGWLAKSGTSPIEALNRFVDSPSSDAIMSDVAPARRGSTPVVSVAMESRVSEGGESEFARAFKPFYVKANTFVAPPNRFTSTRTARQSAVIDAAFTSVPGEFTYNARESANLNCLARFTTIPHRAR